MSLSVEKLYGLLAGRVRAFPAKLIDNPLRTSMLFGYQLRNSLLDGLFYDVGAVRESEFDDIARWMAREGMLLIVPPTSAGADLSLHHDLSAFLAAGGGGVRALTVAGVGSSAVGAAALARNVADAVGGPVAALVSGYGLSDLATEALGGWFWFGGLNAIRHMFEPFDRATKLLTLSEMGSSFGTPAYYARTSRDTATLIELLGHPDCRIPLLVGHSKGNLVLSEALYALQEEERLASLAARSAIVTISAKVGMPAAFAGRVFDVMGEDDAFGMLNSRPDIETDMVVEGAGHSTNPQIEGGIDVTAVMRRILAGRRRRRTAVQTQAPAGSESIFDMPQWSVGMLAAG